MDNNRIIELIQNPDSIRDSDKYYIEQELRKYPFTPSFQILQLKWKQIFSPGELGTNIEVVSMYSTHRELIKKMTVQQLQSEVLEDISAVDIEEAPIQKESIETNIEEINLEMNDSKDAEISDIKKQEGNLVYKNKVEDIHQHVNEVEVIKEDKEVKLKNEISDKNKGESLNKSFINKLGISHLFTNENIDQEQSLLQENIQGDFVGNKENNESKVIENKIDKEVGEIKEVEEEKTGIDKGVNIHQEPQNLVLKIKQEKSDSKENKLEDKYVYDKQTTEHKITEEKIQSVQEIIKAEIEEEGITPIEKLTFNEWLSLSSRKVSVNYNKDIPTQEKQQDIIGKFIETNPKISPPKKEIKTKQDTNFKKEEIKDIANLMTITLAKLYVEQGKYDTAITAFKILSLKYPEKISYFASEIRKVKKIKNSK